MKLLIYSRFFPPIVGGNSCFGCAFAVMAGNIEERVGGVARFFTMPQMK